MAHKSKKKSGKLKRFSPLRRWWYRLTHASVGSSSLFKPHKTSKGKSKHASKRHKKKSLKNKLLKLFTKDKYIKEKAPEAHDTFLRTGGQITDYSPGLDREMHHQAKQKSEERYKNTKKRYTAPKKRKSQDIGGAGKFKRKLHEISYRLYLTDTPYDPWLHPDRPAEESPEKSKKRRLNIRPWAPYVVNSSILYVLAYLLVYLTYQLSVILMASRFGIDSVLYYFEVMFPIGNQSALWTDFSIISITLAGPLVCALLGILYYRWFLLKKAYKDQLLRLFLIWMSFHSLNMFFGAWTAGIITNQGFGYVANWLFLPTAVKFFISLVFIFLMMLIGYKSTNIFLETSQSAARVRKHNRPYFILSQGLIPWFLGTLVLLFIKLPNAAPQHSNILIYDAVLLFSILALIIPMFFNSNVHPHISGIGLSRRKTRMNFMWLMLAVLMIVLYRIGLSGGLHFLIHIDINISAY